jgi:hypothetical protein
MEATGLLSKIGACAKLCGVTWQKTVYVFGIQNYMTVCVFLQIDCLYI